MSIVHTLLLNLSLAAKRSPFGHPRRSGRSAAIFSFAALLVVLALASPSLKAEARETATVRASASVVGEQLAHARVAGSLGPWRRAEVVLTQSSEVDDAPFSGVVIARDSSGNEVRAVLPPPDEPESLFIMKVRSVIFRNVDKSPDNELIVMYSAAKIGPQQDPYFASCVYKWQTDGGFLRLRSVENALQGARDSKAVGKRLLAAARRGTL